MDTHLLHSVGNEAVRLLILYGAPCVAAALVASVLIGFFQAATNIHEHTINYVGRLIALVGIGYLLTAALIESLKSLLGMVLE